MRWNKVASDGGPVYDKVHLSEDAKDALVSVIDWLNDFADIDGDMLPNPSMLHQQELQRIIDSCEDE